MIRDSFPSDGSPGPRDPRKNPERGDYLIVSPRRHVRVESVAPSFDREAMVQVSIFNPSSRAHHLDTWALDWYRREVMFASVGKEAT